MLCGRYMWEVCFCFSVDYIPHALEKHYVHQGEKYRAPEGEMDMMTNYTREYTSMYHVIILSLTVWWCTCIYSNSQSLALSPITHGNSSYLPSSVLHYHRLHLLLLAQYFILFLILGSSANPFLHRPFPFLPDWYHRLSDHLMILLCSTAWFVCMMC